MQSSSNFAPPSLHFSGHETFPLRQLWLRKAYESIRYVKPFAPKTVFSDEEAIVRFGVGKNMALSIRHWALACGVMQEGEGGGFVPTDLARKIFEELDPYSEHPATAWLLHWQLAGIGLKSTTWWWLFNCVPQQTFDREAVISSLKTHCDNAKYKVSASTLLRDVDVCLASYAPRATGSSKEDVAEPILAELPLLQQHTGTSSGFSFRRGPKTSLPDGLFAYALIEYWTIRTKLAVLPFDRIAYDYGSPGRVFKMDETSVGERVVRLEELTEGALVFTDSSGIRQVNRTVDQFSPRLKEKLLEAAYA